jgi:hypothetical protein
MHEEGRPAPLDDPTMTFLLSCSYRSTHWFAISQLTIALFL